MAARDKRTVQLLAVAGTTKADTDQKMAQLQHVAGQEKLFNGHDRTYEPANEGGQRFPAEPLKVRVTADEVLAMTADVMTRQLDLALTLDTANAAAKADVEVDGLTLKDVPVSHLLYLARELTRVRDIVAALPVRDPGKDWDTEGMPEGQAKAKPVETFQREKVPGRFVLAEATQYHPAQVQRLDKDEVVGTWTTVPFSGAVDPKRKEELLRRVDALSEAVRMAREGANTAVAPERREGADIFGWLFRS